MHKFTTVLIATSLASSVVAVADPPCSKTDTACRHAEVSAKAAAVSDAEPLTISVGLAGYSPVSYLERRKAEPGSPRIAAQHEGVTYFFTDDRQRRAFLNNPERYLPAYGGYCAFGCSVDSKFVPDPTSFEIIDGRTHLFLKNDEVDAQALWNEANVDEIRTKADRFWSIQSRREKAAGR